MWSFYMTANALWNQICTRGISNRYANVAFTTFAQIYSWFCTILITFALSKFGANPFFVQLDVQGLQRLIGVVTYLSKFLPQLSTVREPLRHLTDSNSRLPQHEDAFTRITSMKKEMTATPLRSHLGIQYTTSSARDIMYWREWPLTSEAVQRCNICQQTTAALPKGPSMTFPIPNLSWQIVASDCFECDGSHYLIVVDLYSDYIEIKQL